MATLLANDFSSFDLTSDEARAGALLTVAQVWNIQNQLSQAAVKKLNLKTDPLNPIVTVQEEAALAGEINVLRRILNESMEAQMSYKADERAVVREQQTNQADQIFVVTPKPQ